MPDVVIVGAGIGGLASALSLHAVGVRDVVILEAAAELEPLGVGLNILPNAVRELAALNVLDELSQQAVHTDELVLRTRRGGLVCVSRAEPPLVTGGLSCRSTGRCCSTRWWQRCVDGLARNRFCSIRGSPLSPTVARP